MEEAYAYIIDKLQKLGDYSFLPEGVLGEMLKRLIALDEAFMQNTGVNDGMEYDDDAALAALHASMAEAFPEYKMYMLRLSEDYLDYNEEYLDSIGAIDWN